MMNNSQEDKQVLDTAVQLMARAESIQENEAYALIVEDAQLVLRAAGLEDQLARTVAWFILAVPNPVDKNRAVQLGCHLEETAELLESLGLLSADFASTAGLLEDGQYFKRHCPPMSLNPLDDFDSEEQEELRGVVNRTKLADAIGDGIVTLVGLAHMYGLDVIQILKRVNDSNYSKFVDGKPVFDANGKVAKGQNYQEPDLSDLV